MVGRKSCANGAWAGDGKAGREIVCMARGIREGMSWLGLTTGVNPRQKIMQVVSVTCHI